MQGHQCSPMHSGASRLVRLITSPTAIVVISNGGKGRGCGGTTTGGGAGAGAVAVGNVGTSKREAGPPQLLTSELDVSSAASVNNLCLQIGRTFRISRRLQS